MTKELKLKSSEELCLIVMKLKFQLLENRFLQQAGNLEKPHTIAEIRKTIAKILTILTERQIKLRIGTHGITMYDKKNNIVKSLNESANSIISNVEKEYKASAKNKNETSDMFSNIQKEGVFHSPSEKKIDTKVKDKKVDTENKVVIRRAAGG